MNFDVSVVVLTYNSSWEKLKSTLCSILSQQEIKLEIIIADDGSVNHLNDDEIYKFFADNKFEHYKIVHAKKNGGTVKNLYNGLQYANGRYTKAISPGDMLYENMCLKNWIAFMDEHEIDISFGDAVYYSDDNGDVDTIQKKQAPVNKNVFTMDQRRKRVFINHIVADDSILGATLIMNTQIMMCYVKRIMNKVVYAEDYMTKLMVFDGKKLIYYPQPVIYYEYGYGISTNNNKVWLERLLNDFNAINSIISESDTCCDKIAEKYKRYLHLANKHTKLKKIYKVFLFPNFVYWKWKVKTTKY